MDLQSSIGQLLASRRILVLGPSGSGKTTLSIQLGQLLKIAPIHLDAHFWRPGWVSTPQSEWRATVRSLVRQDSWIMDGTYESTLELRMPAADALIVVESSRLACLWRVLKRKATIDDARRVDAPAGQVIGWDFLRYIWQYPTLTSPLVVDAIEKHGRGKTLIRLQGPREIQQFLSQIQSAVQQQEDAS